MRWHRVAAADEIPLGGAALFELGDDRVAVFRIGDSFYAIGDECSHAEASLSEGEVFDMEVECPRHGSAFDLLTGEARSLPATKPVPIYQVRVEDGWVAIGIEDDDG